MTKQEKAIAIAEEVINLARKMSIGAAIIPNTSKRRNVFRKTYNRRPLNKRKRDKATFHFYFNTLHSVFAIGKIMSTPTKNVDNFYKGKTAIIYEQQPM